jgi:hypothetical protein
MLLAVSFVESEDNSFLEQAEKIMEGIAAVLREADMLAILKALEAIEALPQRITKWSSRLIMILSRSRLIKNESKKLCKEVHFNDEREEEKR